MKKIYGWIIALTLLSFVTMGVFLSIAPDQIPAHYDITGKIDRWGSKYEYVLLPGVTAFMAVFLTVTARLEGRKGRESNEQTVAWMCIWVLVLFNALWLFFMWKALDGTGLTGGGTLMEKGMLVLFMAILIPIGNRMPRAERNSLFGLRTRWSMADDVCWQKTQRFGGYLMVGTGIAGVALISLLPDQWGSAVVLALMGILILASCVGSYWIWKQVQAARP